MSQEKLELLRPVLAEWAEGNFWGSAELMAPDITFRAAPPANFVAQGREEAELQEADEDPAQRLCAWRMGGLGRQGCGIVP